jgi:hypothetical protein
MEKLTDRETHVPWLGWGTRKSPPFLKGDIGGLLRVYL